ncbi:MAG: sugar ABC transporter permease [Lachnospiraceae bacterium]|nr:sugar ABC transporter permease [Lachnospiraceae bacterium]
MGTREKKVKQKKIKQEFSWQLMYKQRYLLLMSVPFVVWLIIFKYIPLWGWTMAFQDVKPATFALSFFERTFVGFDNFTKAFSDRIFAQTMINTIALSILGIALGTVSAIVFALMLNELRYVKFKKITQTISYLPHFVSWVVIASIAKMVFNDGGMLDMLTGKNLKLMSTNSALFWVVICIINVWKEVGWDAIVYLSAMAGIDQGLYEAAKVDGANRLQRIWHITLPGIKPTVVVLLIMSVGSALNVGMERQMLLSNAIVQDHAMVLSWFAYLRGIGNNNYGVGTAIGMFQSLVGITLLLIANKIAGWLGESKLV